jgi:hypothetical protein
MPDPDPMRTQRTLEALGLAEGFNLLLQNERIRGPVSYRLELSAPEGMSTAGGKQATQHVKLVPEGGGAVIVAASAHPVERWAELRTYEHLAALHAQRWKGASIPLDRTEYDLVMMKVNRFFADKGFAVREAAMVSAPQGRDKLAPTRGARTPAQAQGGPLGFVVVLVILAAALATSVFVTWFMTHRPH